MIVIKRPIGFVLVLQAANATPYPARAADPLNADVYWAYKDEPTNRRYAGTYPMGARVKVPLAADLDRDVVITANARSGAGVEYVNDVADAPSLTVESQREQRQPVLGIVKDATNTEVLFGISHYPRHMRVRRIQIATDALFTNIVTTIYQDIDRSNAETPRMPEVFRLRRLPSGVASTYYIRVSHTSFSPLLAQGSTYQEKLESLRWGPNSVALAATFADGAGAGGSTATFNPFTSTFVAYGSASSNFLVDVPLGIDGDLSGEGFPTQVAYYKPGSTKLLTSSLFFDYDPTHLIVRATGGFSGTRGCVNVKTDYKASGSAQTTTGNISAGNNVLTPASLIDFKPGHGITIIGAGSGGADLHTKVQSVGTSTITLDNNALTPVIGAVVRHDDTGAIALAVAAAYAAQAEIHFPAGTYYTDTITGISDSFRVTGNGMRRSILKARSANKPVIEVTSSTFHSVEISDIGIEGYGQSSGSAGHGIHVHNNGGLVFTSTLRNVEVRLCGGKGIFLLENFSTLLENISISNCGGNGIEGEFDNSCTLINCYIHDLATNAIGYRIYSGGTVMIGCNGMDNSTTATWGLFGKSLAAGDDTDAYCRLTMHGCNVEDFTKNGVEFRAGSYLASVSNTSFWAAAGHTTAIAIKLDYIDETMVGFMDAGCRFALKSGAAWKDNSPIHANNVPFVSYGARVPGGKYFDTSLSGGGLLVDLPYVTTARNTTTNKGSVKLNSLAADALDSDLVPTITNFRNLGSATYTLKEIHVGDKVALAAGATKVQGANVELVNGANPIMKQTAGAVVSRVQTLDDSYLQIGTDTNHDVVIRSNNADRWMIDANGTLRPVTDNARDIGYNGGRVKDLHIAGKIYNNVAQTVFVMVGSGSPEGVVTASPGAEYRRTDGGVGTTLYIKESGTGNTGWVAHAAGTSGANATLSNLSSPTSINQNLLFSSNNAFNIGNSGFTASPANVYVANSIVMASGATTVGGQSWTVTGGANPELKLNDVTTGNVEARFKLFTNDRCIIGTITNHDLCLFANNADRWRVKASGHFLPEANASYDVGGTSNFVRDAYVGRRLVAGGSPPSSSTGTGAGTSPSLSVSDSTFAVFVDLTTGSSPSANAKIFDLTMPVAAPNYYQAILQPANAAAAALNGNQRPFVSDSDVTSTKVTIKSGSTGLAASTQYLWYVILIAV